MTKEKTEVEITENAADIGKTKKVSEQVEDALEELTETDSVKTFKLSKPIMYNGEEITELAFDFEKLTGTDGIETERSLKRRGISIFGHPASDVDYVINMAARACTRTVGTDIFANMSITDFNKIRTNAYFFLLRLNR